MGDTLGLGGHNVPQRSTLDTLIKKSYAGRHRTSQSQKCQDLFVLFFWEGFVFCVQVYKNALIRVGAGGKLRLVAELHFENIKYVVLPAEKQRIFFLVENFREKTQSFWGSGHDRH